MSGRTRVIFLRTVADGGMLCLNREYRITGAGTTQGGLQERISVNKDTGVIQSRRIRTWEVMNRISETRVLVQQTYQIEF